MNHAEYEKVAAGVFAFIALLLIGWGIFSSAWVNDPTTMPSLLGGLVCTILSLLHNRIRYTG